MITKVVSIILVLLGVLGILFALIFLSSDPFRVLVPGSYKPEKEAELFVKESQERVLRHNDLTRAILIILSTGCITGGILGIKRIRLTSR